LFRSGRVRQIRCARVELLLRGAGRCASSPQHRPRGGSEARRPSRSRSESAAAWLVARIERGWRDSCFLSSYFLRRGAQNSGDNICHAVPVLGFRLQPAPSCCREPVILRLALVFRFAPFADDPALVLKAIEGGIQRALLNLQTIL